MTSVALQHPPRERALNLEAGSYAHAPGQQLRYRLHRPAACNKPCPLVLFLHGAFERGLDNIAHVEWQTAPLVFLDPEVQASFPSYFLAPQCPPDLQWVDMPWDTLRGEQPATPAWPLAASIALVQQLLEANPQIDPAKVVVTGFSMGGYGTWDAFVRWPGLFRAAIPICGGGDPHTVSAIAHKPVWAFHAEDDSVVPVERSRQMVKAMRAAGGHPRYTEYPAAEQIGHASWNRALVATPEIFEFLLG